MRFTALGTLILTFSLLAVSAVPADTLPERPLPYSDSDAGLDSVRSLDDTPFAPGEQIKLRATYLGITAGYITMSVQSKTIGKRSLYQLRLEAETSYLIEYLYTLDDRFVSYFDRQGLFSWGYDYHQTHNGSNETRTVRYHYEDGFFTENGKRKGAIDKYTQDLLSTMYFLRIKSLNEGDTVTFPVQTGDDSYDVDLEVDPDARVATKDGWKDAYELRPVLTKSQDKEKAKEHVESISGIRIWLSHDERRIPLKISFPATFGNMHAFLENYEAP